MANILFYVLTVFIVSCSCYKLELKQNIYENIVSTFISELIQQQNSISNVINDIIFIRIESETNQIVGNDLLDAIHEKLGSNNLILHPPNTRNVTVDKSLSRGDFIIIILEHYDEVGDSFLS